MLRRFHDMSAPYEEETIVWIGTSEVWDFRRLSVNRFCNWMCEDFRELFPACNRQLAFSHVASQHILRSVCALKEQATMRDGYEKTLYSDPSGHISFFPLALPYPPPSLPFHLPLMPVPKLFNLAQTPYLPMCHPAEVLSPSTSSSLLSSTL